MLLRVFFMKSDQEEVRELVGVGLGFLRERQQGRSNSKPDLESERKCLRFYAALVLLDLISEVSTLQLQIMVRPHIVFLPRLHMAWKTATHLANFVCDR